MRARTLTSVAVFGLVSALGIAGASREAAGAPDKKSRDARAAGPTNSNEACGCKVPERYRFKMQGRTEYREGGTEYWKMKGVLKRHHDANFLDAEYWQASGTVTLAFAGIYFPIGVQECSQASGGASSGGTFNASGQTLRLKRNGFDVAVEFDLTPPRRYVVYTGPPRKPNPAAGGTLICDETGHRVPWAEQHLSTGEVVKRGKPRRVVRGSFNYEDYEEFRYRGHWKLTAMRG